jgi:hypothetical protein
MNARFPHDDDIWEFSNPREAQRNVNDLYGPEFTLYRSKRKNKKYFIIRPDGHAVHFGQMGYEDFTKHHDPFRRLRYLIRTAHIKGTWKDDPFSPNNLSRNILW